MLEESAFLEQKRLAVCFLSETGAVLALRDRFAAWCALPFPFLFADAGLCVVSPFATEGEYSTST
jgi:hypothetical protein